MEQLGSVSGAWAAALIQHFAAAGIQQAVVSPGSRSGPLTLACLRHPELTTHVVLDERAAAFFALGLAKAEGRPVLLVCTSGSAVANWHPAVVEADMARLPLILLSADRGPEDQDCGTPQTIDQHRLFGPHLRAFHALPPAETDPDWLANLAARVASQSQWPLPGPVQVNVPLREPLLVTADSVVRGLPPRPPRVVLPRQVPPAEDIEALAQALTGGRGLIIAGAEPLPAQAIASLAEALACPIIADPLSGLRFGRHDRSRVMAHSALFLRAGNLHPDWILRFGAFPVSESIGNWLASCDAEQFVVSGDSRWPDPQRRARWLVHGDSEMVALSLAAAVRQPAPPTWLGQLLRAEAGAADLAAAHALPEAAVMQAALAGLPENALLFIGNSMAVRDLDSFSGVAGKRLTVMCNRGANGIDGNLATFFGAAASGRFAAAVAVVGDLTFFHDVGALAAGRGRSGVVCVLDNGGGTIFNHLPQARLPEFERGWLVPPAADLAAATAVWGHAYAEAPPEQLPDALSAALEQPGLTIMRIPIDRESSVRRHRELWAAAQNLEIH